MECDELVVVRRRRRDWRTAAYRLADIVGLHLRAHDKIDFVPGDLSLYDRDAIIWGYVRRQDMVHGELNYLTADSGRRIRVCITRKDNAASTYQTVQSQIRSAEPTGG